MAADPSIVRYIKEQAGSGTGKEEIYKTLLDAGWKKEQINEAIHEMLGKKSEGERPEQPRPADESPAGGASSDLVRYIREQMGAGFRKAQIYDALLRAGWYREEVDAAFYEVARQSSYAPETQPVPAKQEQPKARKRRSRKKIALAIILVALAGLAAMAFLRIFNPLDYFNPFAYLFGGAVFGPGEAKGFSNIGVTEWHYQYDGRFSVAFTNTAGIPITINSVSAECGEQGSQVVLGTTDPTHLEPGAGITYSAGDQKCLAKEPHESYSVALTIRYIDENTVVASDTGTVSGQVE